MNYTLLKEQIKTVVDNIHTWEQDTFSRRWCSHFKFVKNFSEQGAQGLTGILTFNDIPLVFKIGKDIDHNISNEATILKKINDFDNTHIVNYIYHKTIPITDILFDICSYNLCETDSETDTNIESSKTSTIKNTDPFSYIGSALPREILLLEHISGVEFYDFIKSINCIEQFKQFISIIKQLFYFILTVQKKCKYTHYDLHPSNILIEKCDDEYIMYDNNHRVKTYGVKARIIDSGFAHIEQNEKSFITHNIDNYKYGFTCNKFDPLADYHILLLTTAYRLERNEWSHTIKNKYINQVQRMFQGVPYYRRRGWKILSNDILELIISLCDESITKKNENTLLHEDPNLFITNINYLIPLHFNQMKIKKKSSSSKILGITDFLGEFSKLDNTFNDTPLCFVMLKSWCECLAKDEEYLTLLSQDGVNITISPKFTERVKKDFLSCIYDYYPEIKMPTLSYTKLIQSSILMAKCIIANYNLWINENDVEINTIYSGLKYNTPQDYINWINYNFQI